MLVMKREWCSLGKMHLPRHLRLLEAGRSARCERNARYPCVCSGTSMKPVVPLKYSCSANASISKRRRAQAQYGKRSSSLVAAFKPRRNHRFYASRTIPQLPAMTPFYLIVRSSCTLDYEGTGERLVRLTTPFSDEALHREVLCRHPISKTIKDEELKTVFSREEKSQLLHSRAPFHPERTP